MILYQPLNEITPMLTTEGYLIDELLKLPQLIEDRQARFDRVDQEYQQLAATNSLSALNAPLFDGKDGVKRPASNDTERKIAIDFALAQSPNKEMIEERDLALRELQMVKNRFEAARLLVQLLTHNSK